MCTPKRDMTALTKVHRRRYKVNKQPLSNRRQHPTIIGHRVPIVSIVEQPRTNSGYGIKGNSLLLTGLEIGIGPALILPFLVFSF